MFGLWRNFLYVWKRLVRTFRHMLLPLPRVHRATVGVFLTGVLSAHHESRGGQGEASTNSGQQLVCCLTVSFLPSFYTEHKADHTFSKKKKVEALLFFPHRMCCATSAVRWIAADRHFRVVALYPCGPKKNCVSAGKNIQQFCAG